MVGPAILEYLVDYYTRSNSSTDAILTILQVGAMSIFKFSSFDTFSLVSPLKAFYIRTAHYARSYHTLESSAITT